MMMTIYFGKKLLSSYLSLFLRVVTSKKQTKAKPAYARSNNKCVGTVKEEIKINDINMGNILRILFRSKAIDTKDNFRFEKWRECMALNEHVIISVTLFIKQ